MQVPAQSWADSTFLDSYPTSAVYEMIGRLQACIHCPPFTQLKLIAATVSSLTACVCAPVRLHRFCHQSVTLYTVHIFVRVPGDRMELRAKNVCPVQMVQRCSVLFWLLGCFLSQLDTFFSATAGGMMVDWTVKLNVRIAMTPVCMAHHAQTRCPTAKSQQSSGSHPGKQMLKHAQKHAAHVNTEELLYRTNLTSMQCACTYL